MHLLATSNYAFVTLSANPRSCFYSELDLALIFYGRVNSPWKMMLHEEPELSEWSYLKHVWAMKCVLRDEYL